MNKRQRKKFSGTYRRTILYAMKLIARGERVPAIQCEEIGEEVAVEKELNLRWPRWRRYIKLLPLPLYSCIILPSLDDLVRLATPEKE